MVVMYRSFCSSSADGSHDGSALFLVFRGTMSPSDAIADVLFRPDDSPNGIACHGGFLRTAREDKPLAAAMAVTMVTTK